MDISSIFSSRNSIKFLIDQLMEIERRPRISLVNKKETLNQRKQIFSQLDSKLSALKTKASRLTDSVINYFAAKKAVTSNAEKFTASAGYSAAIGNHSLSVERLATSDTRVSKQFANANSDFAGFTTDQTFQIEVAHPTEQDPANRVQISVTISASVLSQSNDAVLNDIADAINAAMSDAVTAGTIDNDEAVQASVVSEEAGKSRLVLRSQKSGYTQRMNFGSSGLLDTLEVNANVQSSGTAGGYMTYIGTSANDSELNSKFVLDGLTFYRDSNNVTDAIKGVTLTLLDTFATTETVTITADVEAVTKEVQGFLDAYNEVVKFLKENAQIDPDTLQRGALTNDLVYREMVYTLSGYFTDPVAGTTSPNYTSLFNIGIEADAKGYLSIKDMEKFTTALETNSVYIADLFNSADGVANKVQEYVNNFVKAAGTIANSKQNIDSQISALNNRINLMDEILRKKEMYLRDELSKLQELMVVLANQQSFFSSFLTY